VDRDMAESVAGVARPLRRAAVLVVWVRADQEGPRSPDVVLIIFALLRIVTRIQPLSLHAQRARMLIIMANSATEMIFTPRWYTVCPTMGRAKFAC